MEKKYTQEQIKEAYNGIEDIRSAIRYQNTIPFILARLLIKAKKHRYFKKNDLKKSDFLGEVSLSEQVANVYENLYKCFVVVGGYKIDEMATGRNIINRLRTLRTKLFKHCGKKLPELKVSKEELDEWMSKVKELSTTDFNIEIDQSFNIKNPSGEHKCDWEEIVKKKYRCKVCREIIFHNPDDKHEH